uniref:Serine/threonine-protein phosphatase n=1 Tax=Electrophorus electricus TaxID=8005 RepID=A0A4W4GDI8_ELEEL
EPCGTAKTEGEMGSGAMRAALLIQRWYRQYAARLEIRRRCTWSIFQSIEYAGEQDQIKLYNFFGYLMDHFTPASSEREFYNSSKNLDTDIEVPDTYSGPHLTFPLCTHNVTELLEAIKHKQLLHSRYVLQLLGETWKLLRVLPNINVVSTCQSKEITICGDLHGHLEDLLLVFYKNGLPSTETPYVFNGDFVDRGKDSMEILLILFSFQLLYPSGVHLNRGNHEDHIVNLRYGFTKEVLGKYKVHGKRILKLLQKIFSQLPLATVIDRKVLVLHGGISDTTDLRLIARLERHRICSLLRSAHARTHTHTYTLFFFSVGLQLVDVLWSDPMPQDGCVPNKVRGGGCYWGPDVTRDVLQRHKLQLLIRSHECKQDGYEFCHDRRVLTIFSASNYYEVDSNRGAYVQLGPDLNPHLIQYQASRSTLFVQSVLNPHHLEDSTRRLSHTALLMGFPSAPGMISMRHWAVATETVLHLGLPWRMLRSQLLVSQGGAQEGMLNYRDWFRELTFTDPNNRVGTMGRVVRSDSIYTLQKIRPENCCGLISFEEFRQTWRLLSAHLQTEISDEAISGLASSIDFNKDGSIDINEFMEAFRLVSRVRSQEGGRVNRGTPP